MGWMVAGALMYAIIPGLEFLPALVLAAAVTPTDPILASSVVGKGKYAQEHVPSHIRHLLQAESGCNDGAAFPFLVRRPALTLAAPHLRATGADAGLLVLAVPRPLHPPARRALGRLGDRVLDRPRPPVPDRARHHHRRGRRHYRAQDPQVLQAPRAHRPRVDGRHVRRARAPRHGLDDARRERRPPRGVCVRHGLCLGRLVRPASSPLRRFLSFDRAARAA